jgi:hypothetical protein
MGVPVKDVRLFHTAVDYSELSRVAGVVANQDREFKPALCSRDTWNSQEHQIFRRVTVHPGAVVLFLAVGRPFESPVFDQIQDQRFAIA